MDTNFKIKFKKTSLALDFTIANTCFKKCEEHLITYKSGTAHSQIDLFIIWKSNRKFCLDYKVICGESLMNQHRVSVMDTTTGEPPTIGSSFVTRVWEEWGATSETSRLEPKP
ncbi:hypothetical protein Lal_00041530 [Lupinus albus]|nr:hypothetical protein Lal_00041530 [Lupinus albus]